MALQQSFGRIISVDLTASSVPFPSVWTFLPFSIRLFPSVSVILFSLSLSDGCNVGVEWRDRSGAVRWSSQAAGPLRAQIISQIITAARCLSEDSLRQG